MIPRYAIQIPEDMNLALEKKINETTQENKGYSNGHASMGKWGSSGDVQKRRRTGILRKHIEMESNTLYMKLRWLDHFSSWTHKTRKIIEAAVIGADNRLQYECWNTWRELGQHVVNNYKKILRKYTENMEMKPWKYGGPPDWRN